MHVASSRRMYKQQAHEGPEGSESLLTLRKPGQWLVTTAWDLFIKM